VVRVVGEGESFGDLGSAGRRGTNAVARDRCQLLVVRRQYYSEIAKAQLKSDSKLKF
jgi:CRP-like cAMP-binding protein